MKLNIFNTILGVWQKQTGYNTNNDYQRQSGTNCGSIYCFISSRQRWEFFSEGAIRYHITNDHISNLDILLQDCPLNNVEEAQKIVDEYLVSLSNLSLFK